MKTPLETSSALTLQPKVDNENLNTPSTYDGESKRSSIDSSSNTITCGRSARSDSTNSTTLSLISTTEEPKENKKLELAQNIITQKELNVPHRKNSMTNQSIKASSTTLLHPLSSPSYGLNKDNSRSTTARSTTSSPQKCKEKRNIFRMGSSLALSLDASKIYYPSNNHNRGEEMDVSRKNNGSKQNISRGFSPKKLISGKSSKSPTSNRKSIFSLSSKSNYNSLEEDHSRKSSMSSVGSGIMGERDEKDGRKKGIGGTSSSKYLSATGRPFPDFAQSSPSSPTTQSRKKSNLLALSRATPSIFNSIHVDSTTYSKSTTASPSKNSPSTRRSLFVQSPYKAVSMDDGHFHGSRRMRRNESVSSSSSERSSQGNLLQIPSSSSYKVNDKP